MKKYITNNYKQTQKLGEKLARQLSSPRKRGSRAGAKNLDSRLHGNDRRDGATVLGLSGNLGGGKTTFLQGFAKGLGIKEKILSPTYVIMKKFEIRNSKFEIFYHIDCYRLKNGKDILELGFAEIIKNPENIVAIEWPERIKKILPKNMISIKFTCPKPSQRVDKNKREIKF